MKNKLFCNKLYSVFYLLIIFIFLSPLIPSVYVHSLSAGNFEVFNETVICYFPQHCIRKIILEEVIVKIYNNGSILINQTMILPNITAYMPAGTFVQNANCSEGFFYISPYKLGHNTSSFIYNGTKNGLYVYYNISYAFGSKYIFILYYNSSGIPVKGCDIKYCCGKIGMKTIYVLWKTNVITNESLPTFPNYTRACVVNYNLSSAVQGNQRSHNIILGLAFLWLSIVILILIFRPQVKINGKWKEKFL